MLSFNRIVFSESIDVNKTGAPKKCIIFHYLYFSDEGFKFQLDIHNECHHALIMSMNLSYIAILNIQGVDYYCIINRISKQK